MCVHYEDKFAICRPKYHYSHTPSASARHHAYKQVSIPIYKGNNNYLSVVYRSSWWGNRFAHAYLRHTINAPDTML